MRVKVILQEPTEEARIDAPRCDRTGERIEGFCQQVPAALDEAGRLLDTWQGDSDVWFGLAGCLKTECWQLGSATYCLRKWPEPDDARADVDEVLGRRNVWQWEDSATVDRPPARRPDGPEHEPGVGAQTTTGRLMAGLR